MKKVEDEPHAVKKSNLPQSKICGAKTRRGIFCTTFAMPNGRCRMHGGQSTGPKTKEGLARSRAANLKHGFYSVKARLERMLVKQITEQR